MFCPTIRSVYSPTYCTLIQIFVSLSSCFSIFLFSCQSFVSLFEICFGKLFQDINNFILLTSLLSLSLWQIRFALVNKLRTHDETFKVRIHSRKCWFSVDFMSACLNELIDVCYYDVGYHCIADTSAMHLTLI